MKNIYKIALLSFIALFTACDDDLDINVDPNSPENVNTGLVLASAEASLITVVGGDLTNLGGFYAQYQTQSPSAAQYDALDQYNINATYADRLWTELYAGCLNDLQFVLDRSRGAGDTGTTLIATCLRSYTYQLLVDLFDAVPYTEALQGNTGNFTPTLTPGQEIYQDLIKQIDAALAAYSTSPVASEVGDQDQIYQGNMDNWVRFANTLKLKIYMRMSYTAQANPAAVTALIAANNFLDEDAAFTNFGTSLNQTNPFYGVQLSNQGTGLGDINNIASSSLLEFYELNDDPRVTAVYRYRASDSTYVALPQGAGDEFNDTAVSYARPNVRQTTPVFLMTVAESNFLQAEGLIRYAGGAGAKQKYDAGVIASFDTYQTHFGFLNEDREPMEVSGEDFVAPGGPYEYEPGADVEATVRQVIIQKWAALAFVNNIESYIETTRTKFPEIVPEETADYAEGNRTPSRVSILPGTTVPSILFYPEDEVNRNPNITQRTSLTENVWWDKKPE